MLPASAGMILRVNNTVTIDICAPRIRGDDPVGNILYAQGAECSPHPRG